MEEHFYYIDPRGRRSGPYSEAELRRLAATGLLERAGSLELAAFGNVLRIEESAWLLPSFPPPPGPSSPSAPREPATPGTDPTGFPPPAPPPDAAMGGTRRPVSDHAVSEAFALPVAGPRSAAGPAQGEPFVPPAMDAGTEPLAPPTTPLPDSSSRNDRQGAIERATYILLGVLPAIIGVFGIHNIVAGYIGRGIVQLVLSLFTLGGLCISLASFPCVCLGVPLWLGLFVWTICEVSLVRCDARGRPFA